MVFYVNGPTEPSRPDPIKRQRKARAAEVVKPAKPVYNDEQPHQPPSGQQGQGQGQGQDDHAHEDQGHPAQAHPHPGPDGYRADGQPARHHAGEPASAYAKAERRKDTDGDRRRSGDTQSGNSWHRLYGLLFDEIDQIEDLDHQQKSRIKKNLRGHLTPHAPPKWRVGAAQTAPPHSPLSHPASAPVHPPAPQPAGPDPLTLATPAAREKGQIPELDRAPEQDRSPEKEKAPLSADQIVSIAAPFPSWVDDEEARENARLSQQLSDCLAQHTGPALRVSSYLQQLLHTGGASRPHVVVDV